MSLSESFLFPAYRLPLAAYRSPFHVIYFRFPFSIPVYYLPFTVSRFVFPSFYINYPISQCRGALGGTSNRLFKDEADYSPLRRPRTLPRWPTYDVSLEPSDRAPRWSRLGLSAVSAERNIPQRFRWADVCRIDNPLARPCTASLIFEDPSFLPISYSFKSASCIGQELASFVVPIDAPNGDTSLIW